MVGNPTILVGGARTTIVTTHTKLVSMSSAVLALSYYLTVMMYSI